MANALDLRERSELCDLLLAVGPAAPTLCEGWTARHLAAHLVVRERDPRAAPGILGLGGPFARYTDKLMDRQMRRPYDELVATIRRPPMGPLSIAAVRAAASLVEYTIHHEDVRRANGHGPRTDRADLQAGVARTLRRLAPLLVAKARISPVKLALVAADGTVLRAASGSTVVTLTGEPVELLLALYGRRRHAEVRYEGAADAVARVEAADFGI
jgi:uncharacterized protein (TIGR03085 family)